MTPSISALPQSDQALILAQVMDDFTLAKGDDPYGERDFGALDHASQRIFWKIDHYDPTERFGSETPADPEKTVRS